MTFPFYRQLDSMDCGPTCIRIIAKYYGRSLSLQSLRNHCMMGKDGVSLLGISEAAEQVGFRTLAVKIGFDKLAQEVRLPCIVHWNQDHFLVVYKIRKDTVYISDPAKGLLKYHKEEFIRSWSVTEHEPVKKGVVLILEPAPQFYREDDKEKGISVNTISHYVLRHKRLMLRLLVSMLIGTLLQLILPFFTQAVVDVGIATRDIQFIHMILLGQLMLFAGSTVVEFVRSWILLHISTRINLSLLSDYLLKLMRLHLSYFDTKITGDILQRINDHKRIESFLTGSTISTIFSLVNFMIFTFIIIIYDLRIFLIFLAGSLLYFGWVLLFLKARRKLDFRFFDLSARNQGATIQLIQGMQEIKLNNCERMKRWEWERIQARLFSLSVRTLTLNQVQQGGAFFINQGKNIIVSFFSAKAVIDNDLTLGGMLAIQYIIGQLNAPVQQFIHFIQSLQDAKISLERINEIHQMEEEEPDGKPLLYQLPQQKGISIRNVSYRYQGYDNDWVLENINLHIPEGKTTAIVGVSGSGKTTLLKLLLKFYQPVSGEIRVGESKLEQVSPGFWRGRCGVVSQEGFIFSDTIANNIALGDERPDVSRLLHAMKTANILEFVESLPLGYHTRIGAEGNGISQGQKQRILIARAVYKDPEYIFFDEATNALDADNESVIMENLTSFFHGRTVVVVAHRLSTVKNADQIIVLDKGRLVEMGTHGQLTDQRGNYYRLVRNQLELGN